MLLTWFIREKKILLDEIVPHTLDEIMQATVKSSAPSEIANQDAQEEACIQLQSEALAHDFARSYQRIVFNLAERLKEHGFGRSLNSKYHKQVDKLKLADNNDDRKLLFDELKEMINKSTDRYKKKLKSGAKQELVRYWKCVGFFNKLEQFVQQYPDEQLNVFNDGIICEPKFNEGTRYLA